MNPADLATVRRLLGESYPQFIAEYDGSNNILYAGIGKKGAATSANAWVIEKFTYLSGNITLVQTSPENVSWDDRATHSYS